MPSDVGGRGFREEKVTGEIKIYHKNYRYIHCPPHINSDQESKYLNYKIINLKFTKISIPVTNKDRV